jgi:hypothetical protein
MERNDTLPSGKDGVGSEAREGSFAALYLLSPNQANAKLSTALTGRTVLLPTDDVEQYTQHVAAF